MTIINAIANFLFVILFLISLFSPVHHRRLHLGMGGNGDQPQPQDARRLAA